MPLQELNYERCKPTILIDISHFELPSIFSLDFAGTVLCSNQVLLKEFHRIVFTHKSEELEQRINTALKLEINELDSYLGGLKSDIIAVKNGIGYKYNNGLAEGIINKIKRFI